MALNKSLAGYYDDLAHVGIPTDDLKKTIAFWEKLGFKKQGQFDTDDQGHQVVFMKVGHLMLVIIGSGLVGLDAAYGLLEQGKEITIVEMADRILPIQLDEKGALEYQKRFEKAGCRFCLGRKGEDIIQQCQFL